MTGVGRRPHVGTAGRRVRVAARPPQYAASSATSKGRSSSITLPVTRPRFLVSLIPFRWTAVGRHPVAAVDILNCVLECYRSGARSSHCGRAELGPPFGERAQARAHHALRGPGAVSNPSRPQFALTQQLLYQLNQHLYIGRLSQELVPRLRRRRFDSAYQYHRYVTCGITLFRPRYEFAAVHPGHHEIRDDEVRSARLEKLESSGAVTGGKNFEAFELQQQPETVPNVRLVIYDENRVSAHVGAPSPLIASANRRSALPDVSATSIPAVDILNSRTELS